MRKHKGDLWIGVITFGIMLIGLVVIFAIGPQRANFLNSALGEEAYSSNYFFVHQLVTVGFSIAAFLLAFKLPMKFLHKLSKVLMILAIFANVLLAIMAMAHSSLAICQLGACRWIGTAGLSFQPAELLKLALVVYLADLMARRKEEGKLESFSDFWWPYLLVCGLSLFFVVILQKDLGTGVALIGIMLATLFVSGVSMKYFVAFCGVILAAGVFSIVASPHRMERMTTFNGGGDSDSSYHIDNALIAIGTGGVAGVGVGNSVQATGYLPESINDSVFAVMGETFGFVGLVAVIMLFMFLLLRLLKMIPYLEDFHGIVVSGVFAWVMVHVIVNIAAMTGLIPLTGITLPLLSYGGTSMMFIAFSLGLCMQISCYTGREVMMGRSNSSVSANNGRARVSRRATQSSSMQATLDNFRERRER